LRRQQQKARPFIAQLLLLPVARSLAADCLHLSLSLSCTFFHLCSAQLNSARPPADPKERPSFALFLPFSFAAKQLKSHIKLCTFWALLFGQEEEEEEEVRLISQRDHIALEKGREEAKEIVCVKRQAQVA